jgi:anti-sigma-K factor RskA
MSDSNLNHELNDELLSAYLDGELTESERAEVEARLATDPDAQQLLHQLRSVSQAVQALPQEPVARDLREQILRRVEKTQPARAAADATILPGDGLPKLTAFQTRRGWIWASLAVAAALMIMVLQSDDEKAKNLPAVASRDESRVERHVEKHDPMPQRSLSEPAAVTADPLQVTKSDSPPPTAIASAPAPSATPLAVSPDAAETEMLDQAAAGRRGAEGASPSTGVPMAADNSGRLSDLPSDEAIHSDESLAARPASPAPGPAPANRAEESTIAAASPPPLMPESRSIELRANGTSALATASAGQSAPAKAMPSQPSTSGVAGGEAPRDELGRQLESIDGENSIVVVHVVAKKDALENKTFEGLLKNNDISIDPDSEIEDRAGGTGGAVNRSMKRSEADRFAGALEGKPAGGQQEEVEMLLVEAPRQTIELCLEGLYKDAENYPGVEVVNTTAGKDVNTRTPQDKAATTNLSRYSRGQVSQEQKDVVGYRFYNDSEAGAERSQSSSDFQGGFRATQGLDRLQKTEQLQERKAKSDNVETRGRARRIAPRGIENSRAEQVTSLGAEVRRDTSDIAKLRRAQTDLKAPAGAVATSADKEAANVQVLFVLSPDRTAPASAPAEKPTK